MVTTAGALKRVARRAHSRAYLFPGPAGKPLSKYGVWQLTNRLTGKTTHGFRSSFRDWAAEAGIDFEERRAMFGAPIGNTTTRAYLRTTLERRRAVMERWAVYLSDRTESEKVVALKGRRR